MRTPAARRVARVALLALALHLSSTTLLRSEEPPAPATGEVRLASGRDAEYTVHFDRNSLRDSVRLRDGLIALTTSGTLLRFDLPALRLVRERIDSPEISCLGRGEGETVFAGLPDGRVCRVDPTTLDLTDVAKFSDAPQWIGWGAAVGDRPAGLVAVIRQEKDAEYEGERFKKGYSIVHDLATQRTIPLDEAATQYLLDRAGRLWLGADKGEWGGRVWKVDLLQGTVTTIRLPMNQEPDKRADWGGVYGFIERRDGQVWTFGGTSHMGFNDGYISRVDGDKPRPLFTTVPLRHFEQEPDRSQPYMPITHVIEEGDGLLVLSYSDVFRADPKFLVWQPVATLEIGYRWGRPDAVGAYPSVCAAHLPERAGEPYRFATVADGYVTLDGKKALSHAIPGQLGASWISRIENTSEGTFYFEYDDRLPFWKLGAKGWEVARLAPPYEPDPTSDAAGFEKGYKDWNETRVLVGPGGAIYTVSDTAVSPGTCTTARRVEGKSVRLGRETLSFTPSRSFITTDGTLWNCFFGELKRFEKDRWQTLLKASIATMPQGLTIKPLNTNGPPWLLLSDEQLWELDPGKNGEKPRFTLMELREDNKVLSINDAIPWTDGALLFATDAGLRAYDHVAQKLSRVDFPEPPEPATHLARDGRGRLWLGGSKGLWLVEPGAKAPETFAHMPWVGRSEVHALAADPKHEDGVIAALGERGVAFVRAGARP
jgi:hypothetical protein